MGGHRGLKDDVIAKAFELGFTVVGATGVEPLFEWHHEVSKRIGEGIIPAEDWHRRNLRLDPREIMPDAASILVLVRPYTPYVSSFPRGVAGYSAHYREYPRGLEATRQLADWLAGMGIKAVTQPRLPGKVLAAKAGMGSYGRNSLIRCREFGSFVTIHAILTDAHLEPDSPAVVSDCGECDVCVRACPVGAIRPLGTLDLTRCIRAHMGSGRIVPVELREAYGASILGCDVCQRCCPRNARAMMGASLPPSDELEAFSLAGLLGDDAATRKERLDKMGTLIGTNYSKENRILADAAIAAGNSQDADLLGVLARTLEHPHAPVRAHSAWAIGRIAASQSVSVYVSGEARTILNKALAAETDPPVEAEITRALERIR